MTGVDDSISDGMQTSTVILNSTNTADAGDNGLSDVVVSVSTTDNDRGIVLSQRALPLTEGKTARTAWGSATNRRGPCGWPSPGTARST